MRIAIVTESFLSPADATTTSVSRLCQHMQRAGHVVLVLAPGDGPRFWAGADIVRTPTAVAAAGAEVVENTSWVGLEPALREFRADVVHLAAPGALGMQVATTAQRLGLPIVVAYTADLTGFTATVSGIAAANLAPNRQAAADMRGSGALRVARWEHGVDTDLFHPGRRDRQLRSQLAPNGEVLLGYAGALDDDSDDADLLTVLDDRPGARLVIIGDGPQRARLEQLLPRAAFVAATSGTDLAMALASLDVFVQPGVDEASTRTARKAMASGVPVVGADAGSLATLVTPGRTGYLVEAGCAGALRARIATLVADADLRVQMAVAARESVTTATWNRFGDELLAHYRTALAAAVAA